MPCGGIVLEELLQQEQVVRQPERRIGGENGFDLIDRFDDLDPRAAAALIRLQQRRPAHLVGVARAARRRR